METQRLGQLKIEPAARQRRQGQFRTIFIVIAAVLVAGGFFAFRNSGTEKRVVGERAKESPPAAPETSATPTSPAQLGDAVLTASGYIVNRERIEISPRFIGVVKWIGVKKGDTVAKDQVVALLDDAEQRAQVAQAGGRMAAVETRVDKAKLDFDRAQRLRTVDSQKAVDDARIELQASRAALAEADGGLALAKAYLDWTVIRSPIDGVVLEKLVDPGELVSPQSFGGTRGPSTAFMALADPADLQVEIDVSESDLAKISPQQKCRVSPEAYPDKSYDGFVAEIAPEANRQKGTLQVKVQIRNPDSFLTPELSARVDFLR
jgi:HlyD family secretion protein